MRKYDIDLSLMPPDSAVAATMTALPDGGVSYQDKMSVLLFHAMNSQKDPPRDTFANKSRKNGGEF